MESENKFLETGSSPYYLNINNTAKEYSNQENTNPEYSLLSTLSKFIFLENNYQIQLPILQQEYVIVSGI
jgi:hypothetical protein